MKTSPDTVGSDASSLAKCVRGSTDVEAGQHKISIETKPVAPVSRPAEQRKIHTIVFYKTSKISVLSENSLLMFMFYGFQLGETTTGKKNTTLDLSHTHRANVVVKFGKFQVVIRATPDQVTTEIQSHEGYRWSSNLYELNASTE